MRFVSLLFFAVWALALFRVIANLLVVHRLRGRSSEDGPPRRFVSIIIPARNEARAIERTVRAFLAQNYELFEVIVVDDCSSDGTGDIARDITDPRLTVFSGEEPPQGWLGKPWAMEQGNRIARGELLLFVDADVHYEPNALRAAVAHIEREPDIAMLALMPYFEMRGFWENIGMPALSVFGFTLLPANRTRAVVLAVGAGTGNLVRRDAYERVGRHEALKNVVIDDIGLARLLRRNGEVTEAVRADGLVDIRMYQGGGEILSGFTKNAFAFVNRSYFVAVPFLLLIIGSSVFPYCAALTGDPFAMATVVLIGVVRMILFANLRYRIDNALFGQPLMAAFWLLIFLRSMWKTGIRHELEWRGRTYDTGETRCFGADR
jgi:glycosyltransferase involved in cell wall biosynthesis